MNKIYSFDGLKEYTYHLADTWVTLAREAHRTAKDKVKAPHLQAEIESLKSEIGTLKALREAMRHEDSLALKNYMDLYAENESLRQYKELAVNGPAQFVPKDEYLRVKEALVKTKYKLAGVSLALDEQMVAWTAYMKSVPTSRSAPKKPAKAK